MSVTFLISLIMTFVYSDEISPGGMYVLGFMHGIITTFYKVEKDRERIMK